MLGERWMLGLKAAAAELLEVNPKIIIYICIHSFVVDCG
jgi:hypothetical protein